MITIKLGGSIQSWREEKTMSFIFQRNIGLVIQAILVLLKVKDDLIIQLNRY